MKRETSDYASVATDFSTLSQSPVTLFFRVPLGQRVIFVFFVEGDPLVGGGPSGLLGENFPLVGGGPSGLLGESFPLVGGGPSGLFGFDFWVIDYSFPSYNSLYFIYSGCIE